MGAGEPCPLLFGGMLAPLKTYYKDDAGHQPGNLQEVMLHETAVSWIRRREALNRMAKPWEETPEQFGSRLKGIVQDINDTLNVEGLCRAFPQRLQKLVDRDGDRISHGAWLLAAVCFSGDRISH